MSTQPQYETDVIATSSGALHITFLGHGSLLFTFQGKEIYIDPFSRVAEYTRLPAADIILITHEHPDHLDLAAIAAIRTPATQIVLTETCGRSSTLVGSVGHSILVRVVIRDPQNGQVLYSAIDLPTVSGTTAETDYGTLTLGSLGGYNIYVGREYELLITGKMHLTRKWTIVFPSTQSVLNFTSDNDLLWYGDLNDDNRVDDTDYDIWVEQYLIVRRGGTITPEMYYKVDSDGNGTLNMDDYSNIVIAYLRGPGVGDY